MAVWVRVVGRPISFVLGAASGCENAVCRLLDALLRTSSKYRESGPESPDESVVSFIISHTVRPRMLLCISLSDPFILGSVGRPMADGAGFGTVSGDAEMDIVEDIASGLPDPLWTRPLAASEYARDDGLLPFPFSGSSAFE